MRTRRLKVDGRDAVYHCIARIVGAEFLLDDHGKECFRRMMRRQANFSGVEIITFCIMSNHVHILIRVPFEKSVSDALLLKRALNHYNRRPAWLMEARKHYAIHHALPPSLRRALRARMGDVSAFMRELKLGFSKWHNKRHQRFGTLWAERFRSLLVQDNPHVIGIVAAYIDLNPVRANIVSDPKDYRWCGYAEALVGVASARSGIRGFIKSRTWPEAAARYRERLFVSGGNAGHSKKTALTREAIRQTLSQGGALSLPEILRLKIRYLTDGIAFGGEAFLNDLFARHRRFFGESRTSAPRSLRALPWPDLKTVRALSRNAVQ